MIMLNCSSRTSQTIHLCIALPHRADQAHVMFSLHNSRVVSYVNELVYTCWKGCVSASATLNCCTCTLVGATGPSRCQTTSIESRRSYSAAMLDDVVLTNEVQMSDHAATVSDATTNPRKRSDDGKCAVTT